MTEFNGLVIGSGERDLDGLWYTHSEPTLQIAKLAALHHWRTFMPCDPLPEEMATIELCTLRLRDIALPRISRRIQVWVPYHWPTEELPDRVLGWFLERELENLP